MGGEDFFVSWELWQKMTFVLAVAIAVVIAVAYSKLLWTNRYLKKHQIIDDEKQARVQELRRSGQLIENPKDDVPFGVRAIQSGIQVDGIWISNTNTPVPSVLNLSLKDNSSGSTSGGESSKSVNISSGRPSRASSIGSITPPRPKSEILHRDRLNGSAFVEHTEGSQYLELGARKSYQPRRSSGLRYHDTGNHYEATLADLESGASRPMLQTQAYPPRMSSIVDSGTSSVADNGVGSGSSSDGEERPECKNKGKGKAKDYMAVAQNDHFSRTTDVIIDSTNAFASPQQDQSSTFRMSGIPQEGEGHYSQPTALDVAQKTSPPRPRSQSPFIPGEVHQNKVVRKVNSGFEVLPAGSFGAHAIMKEAEQSVEEPVRRSEDSTGPKRGRRLQKKRRESTLSTRSSIFHSP